MPTGARADLVTQFSAWHAVESSAVREVWGDAFTGVAGERCVRDFASITGEDLVLRARLLHAGTAQLKGAIAKLRGRENLVDTAPTAMRRRTVRVPRCPALYEAGTPAAPPAAGSALVLESSDHDQPATAGTLLATRAAMTHRSQLSFARLLAALLPLTALATGCTPDLSTIGQAITCNTDPDTGVILRCQPGAGDGAETCTDIDEDGDGEPHDEGTLARTGAAGDEDDDGIPDVEDCDEQPGEDDSDDESSVDLPYNIKLPLGVTTTPILDAFAEKGASPAAIVSVTLDGGSWRLAELQASTPFVVTEADCSHPGNKATGRDRVVVTWENANGSTESDHMEIRYCEL